MSEIYSRMKRRNSSSTHSSAKLNGSVEISRISTAMGSSNKGSNSNSFIKCFPDQNRSYLLTESSGVQSSVNSFSGTAVGQRRRSNSVVPQQLFRDFYSQNQHSNATTCSQCRCATSSKQSSSNKSLEAPKQKKGMKKAILALKQDPQPKQLKVQSANKQEKVKKLEIQKEKKVLKKKINRLTTQIQEEDERQKENEKNFICNIATIKAKIGIIQHNRSQSTFNSQKLHESAKDQLEQKTKELFDIQRDFQSMYSNMVEKHNQNQVDWSLVYTNLLKDKANLKKTVMIKSKLK